MANSNMESKDEAIKEAAEALREEAELLKEEIEEEKGKIKRIKGSKSGESGLAREIEDEAASELRKSGIRLPKEHSELKEEIESGAEEVIPGSYSEEAGEEMPAEEPMPEAQEQPEIKEKAKPPVELPEGMEVPEPPKGISEFEKEAEMDRSSAEMPEMPPEEPLSEGMVGEEPAVEGIAAEEIAGEEPASEEPLSEGMVGEEPMAEEIAGEEPAAEEPPAAEAPKQSREEAELKARMEDLNKKIQVLKWDYEHGQINPAKKVQYDNMKKEYDQLRAKLEEIRVPQ